MAEAKEHKEFIRKKKIYDAWADRVARTYFGDDPCNSTLAQEASRHEISEQLSPLMRTQIKVQMLSRLS